jgi:hypothetical protein
MGTTSTHALPAHDDHYDVEAAVPCEAHRPQLMLLRRADVAARTLPMSETEAPTTSKDFGSRFR